MISAYWTAFFTTVTITFRSLQHPARAPLFGPYPANATSLPVKLDTTSRWDDDVDA